MLSNILNKQSTYVNWYDSISNTTFLFRNVHLHGSIIKTLSLSSHAVVTLTITSLKLVSLANKGFEADTGIELIKRWFLLSFIYIIYRQIFLLKYLIKANKTISCKTCQEQLRTSKKEKGSWMQKLQWQIKKQGWGQWCPCQHAADLWARSGCQSSYTFLKNCEDFKFEKHHHQFFEASTKPAHRYQKLHDINS